MLKNPGEIVCGAQEIGFEILVKNVWYRSGRGQNNDHDNELWQKKNEHVANNEIHGPLLLTLINYNPNMDK